MGWKMFELLAQELRGLWKAVDDNQRRTAATMMPGQIAEIDGNRVRIELGPLDSRTGKKFLSPWVQLQDAAGGTASHTPVQVGDPMRLLSPNGELGPHSLAIRDSHTDDAPNPTDDNQELVLAHAGCTLRMRDGALVLEQEDSSITLSGGEVRIASDALFHNSKNVGDTHKHGGVMPGGGLTGHPS